MIYLDNNATTAVDPAVVRVVTDAMLGGPANASAQHRGGQRAAASLSGAIDSIGGNLGLRLGDPGCPRLILTSGATESNTSAIRGIRPSAPLLVSAVEHPSVIAAAADCQASDRKVATIAVDPNGIVQTRWLTDRLADCPGDASASKRHAAAGHGQLDDHRGDHDRRPVVCVMAANNETGVIQPLEAIAEICHAAGAHLHVDATQVVGKIPIDLASFHWGSVAFSAHKFHGPPGIGGLLLAPGVTLAAMISGGGQQLGSRGGTEPVALAVGMATALSIATQTMAESVDHLRRLRDRFETHLRHEHPDIVIHGRDAPRLPQTSCVSMLGANRQSLLMALDMAGVAASSGAACSSGSSPPSHVLTAMQCREEQIDSALRFGVSKFTTEQEVDQAAAIVTRCYRRLDDRKRPPVN